MQDESELARLSTILVRGVTDSKLGTAILTQDRILFYDEKFSETGTGGILEDLVVGALQKRHEARGPLVEIELSSLTGLALQKAPIAKPVVDLNGRWRLLVQRGLEGVGASPARYLDPPPRPACYGAIAGGLAGGAELMPVAAQSA
jgi:hypothetical protein